MSVIKKKIFVCTSKLPADLKCSVVIRLGSHRVKWYTAIVGGRSPRHATPPRVWTSLTLTAYWLLTGCSYYFTCICTFCYAGVKIQLVLCTKLTDSKYKFMAELLKLDDSKIKIYLCRGNAQETNEKVTKNVIQNCCHI